MVGGVHAVKVVHGAERSMGWEGPWGREAHGVKKPMGQR